LDRHVIGLEALVRWQHPQRGLLMPKDFISLAEETGFIIQIDRWVLKEACRQFKEWARDTSPLGEFTININISGKQLTQPDFIASVENTLHETGVDAKYIILEITESAIVENKEAAIETCNQLRELGIHIQIDDFGIGYSSLSYLSQFPISALKIDQSFIGKMTENSNETNIVHAIVSLSHRLGVDVIAEGVETAVQLDQLKSIGCEYIQGFYISKPLNKGDTKSLLLQSITGSPQNNSSN
jgi:EAL domain-containing protein (putative c-di-GMP-specific phosphodiesterase class I)